jgi:hypothetical protein
MPTGSLRTLAEELSSPATSTDDQVVDHYDGQDILPVALPFALHLQEVPAASSFFLSDGMQNLDLYI